MSVVTTLISALTPAVPQIITGVFTVTGAFGAAALTQRFNQRQRARERASAANAKIEEVTQELFEAVGALHLSLSTHQPAHNAWQPRLMMLGSALLEFMAAKDSDGFALGAARAGRIAVEANQRELLAAETLRAPLNRVLAAASRAALLPDGAVRAAALHLGEVAAESATAYGQDNLWQRKKATAAREEADAALFAALRGLIDAASAHLYPQEQPRRLWRSRILRRRDTGAANAVIETSAPGDGRDEARPASIVPPLPPGQPKVSR
ncbi:hypothetical protein [Micromonospora sp. NPDC048063]|uniref:hypothetical protein n=1 Tax=Micromonospora sp. NPDC048063 TaxID=3364256 RepID=UPI0037186E24